MVRPNRPIRAASLLLSLLLALAAVAGCAGTATPTPAPTAAPTAAPTETPTGEPTPAAFPVTVKDAAGNDVTFTKAPEAIVVLPVWACEMVLDLVPVQRVVGVSQWALDPVLSATGDKAAQVAGRVESKNLEGIIALSPDLVILDTFNDFDGSIGKSLLSAGIPVLTLSSPTDFDAIRANLLTLADALGARENGAIIVEDMDQRLEAVRKVVDGIPEADRIKVLYYEDFYDPSGQSVGMLCAYGEGSTFDSLARAAGVVNVCDAPNYSPISKEKVVGEWMPDLLVVPGIVFNPDFTVSEDGGAAIRAAILQDETLASLPAVQEERIVALTERFRSATSHYMAQAVEELAKAAYPDKFLAW